MKNIVAHDSLVLQSGQLISVSADAALTMQIDCGRVWVTMDGDKEDYWLFDGATLVLIAGRHVVIEADKLFSRIDFLPSLQTVAQPSMQSKLSIPLASPKSDTHAAAILTAAVTAYAPAD
ncbi:MAG: DUF2917 domain-containing protein [Burkholderiaceae bacterium]